VIFEVQTKFIIRKKLYTLYTNGLNQTFIFIIIFKYNTTVNIIVLLVIKRSNILLLQNEKYKDTY
jgi:hypothetical protein